MPKHVVPSIMLAGLMIGGSAKAADVQQGKTLFQAECAACHIAGPGGLGPSLEGVVGRKAGSLPGFRYSVSMRRSGLTWTPQTLTAFVIAPQDLVKGTRMTFEGVKAPSDAAAIVVYLETLKPPPGR